MNFNFKPNLNDEVIQMMPINEHDFEVLYAVASDKELWAGHPSKNRYERNVFKTWFQDALKSKQALKIVEMQSNIVIGSSRYYEFDDINKEIAIGYTFISRKHWGGETNKRIKTLMLNHAFQSVEKVWFHIGSSNFRSQKAIAKIGAKYSHQEKKETLNSTENYFCYSIEKEVWSNKYKEGG